MAADYPNRVEVNVWGFWEHVVGTTPSRVVDASSLGGGYLFNSGGAQNDEIGWKVLLRSGTWTVTLIHLAGTTRGIYTVKLDSTTLGTIDGYSGSTVYNAVGQIAGISVATSGVYTLKLVMATKNASSTNYLYTPHWIVCQRTGA